MKNAITSSQSLSTHPSRSVLLRELVKKHKICFETRTENAVLHGQIEPVGYVIEVSAVHDHPHKVPVAGCEECAAPLRALEEVLHAVVPTEPHGSKYQIRVRWSTLQCSPQRENRAEVVGAISILHGNDAGRPIDACQMSCRDEIVSHLQSLGVREGSWYLP